MSFPISTKRNRIEIEYFRQLGRTEEQREAVRCPCVIYQHAQGPDAPGDWPAMREKLLPWTGLLHPSCPIYGLTGMRSFDAIKTVKTDFSGRPGRTRTPCCSSRCGALTRTAKQNPAPPRKVPGRRGVCSLRLTKGSVSHPAISRYRKVAIWARVQLSSGAKWVSSTPLVMPLATAQLTASAYHSPAGTSTKPLSPLAEPFS